MLYGESKSAGSCGHFKFHTKRDATISRLLQTMSDGPSLLLAPLPLSLAITDLTNTTPFSCGTVRDLPVSTCPISSLFLPVRRTIDVGLSISSSSMLLLFFLSSLPQLFSTLLNF